MFFVKVTGLKSGTIKGDVKEAGHEGWMAGLAFHYGVTSPRDLATGQASGKRQHSPVTFVKPWDAASPLLFQAVLTNELLSTVIFEFVASGSEGAGGGPPRDQVVERITLTNASVASLQQKVEGAAPGTTAADAVLEEVSLTFQKIELLNVVAGLVGMDDPSARLTAGSMSAASPPPVRTSVTAAAQVPAAGLTTVSAVRGRLAG